LALITQYVAFATRTTNAAVIQVNRELEEAGEVSGANRIQVLWQITLPLIRPAFVAAWIWVAAHAVRAFSIPLLLSSRESRPIGVMLWHYWDVEGNQPAAAALGVMLIAVLTLVSFSGRFFVATARGSKQG
jgi:iron(III) transport system permease protein